jgi:hypothetical protein
MFDLGDRVDEMVRDRAVPAHPERVCWGCQRNCPADVMACGADRTRAQHPKELFGADWELWVERRPRGTLCRESDEVPGNRR